MHSQCKLLSILHIPYPKNQSSGQVLMLTLGMLALVMLADGVLLSITTVTARRTKTVIHTIQARALAEAGLDRALQEIAVDSAWTGVSDQPLGTGTYTVTVSDADPGVTGRKKVVAQGAVPNRTKPLAQTTLELIVLGGSTGNQISFQYAVQAGDGGIDMHLGSRIRGNVWSNGPILGSSSAQNQVITGSATSAGVGGELERVQVNGTANAHILDRMITNSHGTATTCQNSTIFGNLYAPNRTACTVVGSWTQSPPPTDPSAQTLPITDEVVDELRATMSGNPIQTGNLDIAGFVPTTLGPLTVTGNLTLATGANVTLTGSISVMGNIIIGNSASVTTDATIYGTGKTAILLADGNFTAHQGARFVGLASILAVAATGNVTLNNSVRGDNVLFVASPHGNTDMNNGAVVKQISANRIILRNFAEIPTFPSVVEITYGSGTGSGIWQIEPGSYRRIGS